MPTANSVGSTKPPRGLLIFTTVVNAITLPFTAFASLMGLAFMDDPNNSLLISIPFVLAPVIINLAALFVPWMIFRRGRPLLAICLSALPIVVVIIGLAFLLPRVLA